MTTRPDIPYDGPATGGRCRARGLGAMSALLIAPVAGMAQSDQQMNDANNPLTPTLTANLQDQWAPQLYDSDNSTNALLLRGVLPYLFGGVPQILRATLPIATAPSTSGSGNTTGLGDLNLFDLALFKEEGLVLGIGPQLTLPTASDQALGTGKWQAGLAAVAIAPQTWGLLGGLVTWQHSFAGESDRPTQNNLTVQPFFIYNLPQGVYLRSTAIWNFDLARSNYAIPIGAGVGKVFAQSDGSTINLFAEPQWTVIHHGAGQPKFQLFAGVNFQFPVNKKQ